jgi:hypothetical protein
LAWIFDLKNQTKNFELKYVLEEVECRMNSKDQPPSMRIKVNPENVLETQVINDGVEYYEEESFEERRTIPLMRLKQKDLPCSQQYREQLEHPSSREFIGMDLSWIRSSALSIQASLWATIFSCIVLFGNS